MPDSWLFDHAQKQAVLRQVFDATICFPYSSYDVMKAFMQHLGYTVSETAAVRLNVTDYDTFPDHD